MFHVCTNREREETGNSECVEFLQSILEIPHTSLPVDSPSTELSLNEIKQWLCTERLYCLIDIQTRSVVILGLCHRFTQALVQWTLCTEMIH